LAVSQIQDMKNYLRYFYAILAVPVIVLLRYALMPLVGPGVPYLTLFPVSVGVALLAGLGPAILTGILGSIVIDYLFIPPLYEIDFTTIDGISRIAVVTLTSAFVGYVGEVLREARAKAEKQAVTLRESQQDLNRAQAVGNIGSWRLDVRRNELTWSDENHRIFGIPKGTPMTYETFLGTVHPDDREYVDTKWKAGLAGEPYDIEHRIIADGQVKWVREKAYLEFDKEGALLGGFGITQDITERKKAEEALRERQEMINAIVETSQDWIWAIDTSGRHTYSNPAIESILGYTPEEFKGIGLDLVHQEDRHTADSQFAGGLKARQGWNNVVLRWRSKNGTYRYLESTAVPILGPQGELLGFRGVDRDITERKQAEDALRQAQDELEIRVEERTAQLSHTIETLEDEVRERMLAEEAVKAERQRFYDVLETLPVYVCLLTPDYHMSFANRFFRKRFGESKGRHCYEYLFGRSEPCEICETYTVMKTGKSHEWEWTGPDGRNYYIFDLPFADTDGSPLILEMGIDITERKTAEVRNNVTNTLLELFAQKTSKQDYLDSVVKVIHNWSGCRCVGIRLLNSEGYIPYASYVGFTKEFLILENMLSIEADVCACIRVITGLAEPPDAAVMTSKGSFRLDNSNEFLNNLTEKEKSLFRGNCVRSGFVSIAVVPVRYHREIIGAIHLADEKENKIPVQNVEFLENVALLIGEAVHRFDTEAELRESEERYRQLVELSPDGISVEIDNKIAFINTAGVKLLGGETAEQLTGQVVVDFVYPSYYKELSQQIAYLLKKGGKMPSREAKFLRLDGTVFDVEVSATALVYKNKPAAQIVFRDITERKAAEEKILANQKQLRSLTAELVLTEERERRLVAMELHDSLGPILAFSKRELGTLQKSVPKKVADTLKNISDNIGEAINQTRNLTFDLSPPALYTFGFEMAVAELAERLCEHQKLQVIFENSDEPKPLSNHIKILLYRSIRELLINIIKHSKAKIVHVALSRADDNMKIVVKDDGKGFDMSEFYSKSGGTSGFGLFSVRERLTHIGGVFDIQSGKGKGTTVTLLAPLELNGVSHPLREKD